MTIRSTKSGGFRKLWFTSVPVSASWNNNRETDWARVVSAWGSQDYRPTSVLHNTLKLKAAFRPIRAVYIMSPSRKSMSVSLRFWSSWAAQEDSAGVLAMGCCCYTCRNNGSVPSLSPAVSDNAHNIVQETSTALAKRANAIFRIWNFITQRGDWFVNRFRVVVSGFYSVPSRHNFFCFFETIFFEKRLCSLGF